ncbi:hypothetical protein ACC677_37340, partial [Rhizobium ruizarguesonis]
FLMSIRFLAGQMLGMFYAGPRLARLLASHQKGRVPHQLLRCECHYAFLHIRSPASVRSNDTESSSGISGHSDMHSLE